MNPPTALQDLISEIAHSYPTAQIEFDPLPSGVCFFWVTLNQRNIVLEYHPTQGVGVSENRSDTPPFVGHDEVFGSLPEAIERFRTRLGEVERTSDTSTIAA